MSQNDPAKRIPKAIGTDAKLFGPYTLGDMSIGLLPAVLVVLGIQLLVPADLTVAGVRPQVLTIPLAVIAVAVGLLFVFLTPSYTTSTGWLASALGFYRRPRQLDFDQAKACPGLERVHPDLGVIERTDGAFIGIVRVDPPSLALATDADWRAIVVAFQDFCNTVLEFPVQFYSTTQPFPVDDYLEHFDRRLADPDVKANPRLAALITAYLDWYAADLEARQMTIRDHYVIVPVRPHEITFHRASHLEHLARLPVVGGVVRLWYRPDPLEEYARMADLLDHRLERVVDGIRAMDGCTAAVVSVEDAVALIGEFWTGESLDERDLAPLLRTRPIIGGPE